MQIFTQTWHWAISGFIFGAIMLSLVYLGGYFGLSSSYRSICSMGGWGRVSDLFKFDWKAEKWHLFLVGGIIIGGAISRFGEYLQGNVSIQRLPPELYHSIQPSSLIIIFTGGILSGFGTRYAGGCTSGHFISGISNIQLPSMLTLVFFMIGGIITSHYIIPFLIK